MEKTAKQIFHIIYYPEAKVPLTKCVNIHAVSMGSALIQFQKKYGFIPLYIHNKSI
jgi:hypothetical protein